jgi:hypothetical protein
LPDRISPEELENIRAALQPLVGTQFRQLALPIAALKAFEPSQIGSIVGALMDALIPNLPGLAAVGLSKHEGILGEREGYPDYHHNSGARLELKLLYIDNPAIQTKRPPTPREPSARLTQKVTLKNVDPSRDAMLLIAYRLEPQALEPDAVSPTIIDYDVLSIIELVESRDERLLKCGGLWFGDYETPAILSKAGRLKNRDGIPLDVAVYGRKQSEGKDYNEDTNFGKLKRIPHKDLQAFLKKYHVSASDKTAKADSEVPLKELPRDD